eukprot:Tbor_TRINITY_DN3494_c0_g1::TRINITY_DN3494_c0_g1_i2::g.3755::m.3755
MFGLPRQQSAPQKSWNELYFHRKVLMLIEHGADFIIDNCNYWIPSVCLTIVGSLFVFSGPNFIPEALSIAIPVTMPVAGVCTFATPPGAPGGHEEGELLQDMGSESIDEEMF